MNSNVRILSLLLTLSLGIWSPTKTGARNLLVAAIPLSLVGAYLGYEIAQASPNKSVAPNQKHKATLLEKTKHFIQKNKTAIYTALGGTIGFCVGGGIGAVIPDANTYWKKDWFAVDSEVQSILDKKRQKIRELENSQQLHWSDTVTITSSFYKFQNKYRDQLLKATSEESFNTIKKELNDEADALIKSYVEKRKTAQLQEQRENALRQQQEEEYLERLERRRQEQERIRQEEQERRRQEQERMQQERQRRQREEEQRQRDAQDRQRQANQRFENQYNQLRAQLNNETDISDREKDRCHINLQTRYTIYRYSLNENNVETTIHQLNHYYQTLIADAKDRTKKEQEEFRRRQQQQGDHLNDAAQRRFTIHKDLILAQVRQSQRDVFDTLGYCIELNEYYLQHLQQVDAANIDDEIKAFYQFYNDLMKKQNNQRNQSSYSSSHNNRSQFSFNFNDFSNDDSDEDDNNTQYQNNNNKSSLDVEKEKKLGTAAETLGLSYKDLKQKTKKEAVNDIKRSFRDLARKWHPDKNMDNKAKAEAQFKEIGAAYEQFKEKYKF